MSIDRGMARAELEYLETLDQFDLLSCVHSICRVFACVFAASMKEARPGRHELMARAILGGLRAEVSRFGYDDLVSCLPSVDELADEAARIQAARVIAEAERVMGEANG